MESEWEINRLEPEDFDRAFLELLEQLTTVGSDKITRDKFIEKLNKTNSVIWVIRDYIDGVEKVVGTASVLMEEKFIHNLSSVCHIEDVVVDKRYRGKGLGKCLVEKCIEYGKNNGAYKIILDCVEKNRGFYSTMGFEQKCIQMSLYLE